VLLDLWKRFTQRRDANAVKREVELQQGSPAERHFAEESFEDRKADSTIEERLGGGDHGPLSDGE